VNAPGFAFLAPLTCLLIGAGEPPARADTPEQILKNLKDPSPRVRQLAAEAAGNRKVEAAVALLGELLKDKSGAVRQEAADALENMGAKAVPILISAVQDENVTLKELALQALGRIGPDAKEAVEAVTVALKHKDVRVRYYAAVALGQIGAAAKAALPELFAAATDTTTFQYIPPPVEIAPGIRAATMMPVGVASAAVVAVLHIDPDCGTKLAEATLPNLVAALDDKNPVSAQCALAALLALRKHALPAVPALEKAQLTATASTDMLIPMAIAAITGDSIKPYRDVIANTKLSIDTRAEAVGYLGGANPAKKALAVLNEFLTDPQPRIRVTAVATLSSAARNVTIRDRKFVLPNLLKLLGDSDVRKADRTLGPTTSLAAALAQIGPDVVPDLIAVVEDDNKPSIARYQAAEALGLLGPKAKAAKPALEDALDDLRPFLRVTFALALVQVGGDIKKALPVLRDALRHTDRGIDRAARSQGQVGPDSRRRGARAGEVSGGRCCKGPRHDGEIRERRGERCSGAGAGATWAGGARRGPGTHRGPQDVADGQALLAQFHLLRARKNRSGGERCCTRAPRQIENYEIRLRRSCARRARWHRPRGKGRGAANRGPID
jgi:HEAT repeat protein